MPGDEDYVLHPKKRWRAHGGFVPSVAAGDASITVTTNPDTGVVTLTGAGGVGTSVASVSAGAGITVTGTTSVTVATDLAAGTGISLSGAHPQTIANTGVTALASANAGLTVSAATGSITVTRVVSVATPASVGASNSAGTGVIAANEDHAHQGVHSAVAGSGVLVSGAYGDVTFSLDFGSSAAEVASSGTGGVGTTPSKSDHAHRGVHSAVAGSGISVSGAYGDVTFSNTGVLSNIAGTGISVSGATGNVTITNSGVTALVAGTAISVSGATGSVTVTNTGVTSAVAGTGVSVSGATGAVTFTNTGVTSAVAGNGISLSGATGAVTITNNIAAGTAISISGTTTLTIANAGVTSAVAGTGVSVSGATGAVTFTNTGVTSAVAGTGISVSGATGAVTFTNSGVTQLSSANAGITVSAATGSITITRVVTATSPADVAATAAAGSGVKAANDDHAHALGSGVVGSGVRLDSGALSDKLYYKSYGVGQPHWKPTSPTSYDKTWDDDGSGTPTDWTALNSATVAQSNSLCSMANTLAAAGASSGKWTGMYRALPASGRWRFEAHLALDLGKSTNVQNIHALSSLYVMASMFVTDLSDIWGTLCGPSNLSWRTTCGSNTGTSGVGGYTVQGGQDSAGISNYHALEYDGTNVYFYTSTDGKTWAQLNYDTPAAMGITIGSGYIGLGMYMRQAAGTSPNATFTVYSDYFVRTI